ncbi:2-amino-3-ketobutyrate coenzyme A ligase [Rubritalea squalenifaciens DSM 18772]|uniref:2-amino-3-ketobutyrate coenzyme A ligase n=1 Tax=Rubritalea squalenifaciens DSM 18772 TaxID=1123071 RepID=A0A1M6LY06_9BACT|nr:glycine C-acetyltransferase [Rubritalea squalenifaciens]SHJ75963.1 2-amino-3-ketobutyrate coenzyme A ligase [Rubritalea squalenifaciens DSM 18772]
MYPDTFKQHLESTLDEIKEAGLFKSERYITSTQNSTVTLKDGREVINMCANNYLGLADHPRVVKAASEAAEKWGFGMASVRFICGTQTLHRQLEEKISEYLGTEDTILYPSCFDANGGLFEVLLTAEDAVISDSLNHASIIDGVRLCKAKRFRYANNNMEDLEAKLKEADEAGARFKLITTDGVFSMDGIICDLDKVYALAEKYNAIVHHDDCHATGFLGERGRGTHEHCGLFGKIDITTGTLGKALGGASGGYTSGKKEIIDLLRQRSRPYLFSNSIAPVIAAASLEVFDMLTETNEYADKVKENTKYFRDNMASTGFTIAGKDHPISPVMLGDAALSQKFSEKLLDYGVFAIGFFYPVVPHNTARIRTQISAAHTKEQLDRGIEAFIKAGKDLSVI